jgi:predicted ATPase/class 3 adenylate cyclase/GAF domain-containing protein
MVASFNYRGPTPAIALPGYKVLGRCWDDARAITFGGEHLPTGAPVFIKMSKAHRMRARDAGELKHDYDLAKAIGGACILKPLAYLANDTGEILILEDDGTRPIGELLLENSFSLVACLEFAVRFAKILDELHRAQVVHRNLNPYSVWFDLRSLNTKITDFSMASLGAELAISSAWRSQTDILYVAPEQTGRVNQPVDCRTDLYAVGVLLYQLVTGRPPFDESNAIDMVHAHIAHVPIAPHVLDRQIPEPVSQIITKLLSKSAEERYQSAWGLQSDLSECLAQWRAHGTIGSLAVGARDAAASFRISQTMYGRETELTALRSAMERAARGARGLVLLCGVPGVGKSALVKTVEPEARVTGLFIAAKFDQFRQNEPYVFIVQGFTDLIRQLLADTEETLRIWRERLAAALGVNARIIVEVIPEVELIIGPQPPVQRLPPAEERNRFNSVFRSFVRVFARADRPLYMFLDDLQWADRASLTMLKTLLSDPDMTHFLVIGAYRDDRMDESSDLARTLDDLRIDKIAADHIRLSCLQSHHIGELLRDTFRCSTGEALEFARLVLQKTDGNPLFVNEFLRFLHNNSLIEFDFTNSCWIWDLRRIAVRGVTDNIIELMTRKLEKLPTLTKEALKAAACLGNRFDVTQLALIMQEEPPKLLAAIHAAEREGLVLSTDSGDGLRDANEHPKMVDSLLKFGFQFLHDRVQQAAYELIPSEVRREMRLKIGRKLLASLSNEERDAIPFAVLDNLNEGADLISDSAERGSVAKLNLVAGRRARETAAYDAALGYFRSGTQLLAPNAWQAQYELTLDLYLGRFECAYVTGLATEAHALFDQILSNGRTSIDKSKAYYTKILLSSGLDHSDEAVSLGIAALRLFDQKLPQTPTKFQLLRELAYISFLLRGRRADTLLKLPPMTDDGRKTSIGLLMSICPAAYFRNPDLMSLAALKIMGMSLCYGNATASSFGYVLYGLIQGALFGCYKLGHEFGQLAVKLAEHDETIIQRCKIVMIFGGFISYWRQPIDSSIEVLRSALKLAGDAGDVQYANYSILQIIFLSLARGAELENVYAECARHEPFIRQTKDWFAIASYDVRCQFILALRNKTESGTRLSDEKYDEDAALASFRAAGNLTTLSYYLIVKMQLEYLFGEYDQAHCHAEASEAQIKAVINQVVVAEHYFYRGLIGAALIRRQHPAAHALWRILRYCRARLRKWAHNCPENFLQHHLLLEAVHASLMGRENLAEHYYESSIEAARHQRFHHLEALASELAAESCLASERRQMAKAYLVQARKAYSRWGAVAKVQQLSQAHEQLLSEEGLERERGTTISAAETSNRIRELIDLDTMIRATNEISVERESNRLLAKLMRLILESAGGERGFVVKEEQGLLCIEATSLADAGHVGIHHEAFAEGDLYFSPAIVKYVLRTGHRLVLDDAQTDPRFVTCAYLKTRRTRSVLCIPLTNKGEIVGAVYVENNLASGAFTADRLKPMTLLSQQIAAVIENSRLSRNLKEKSTNLQLALSKIELLEHVKGHLAKFVPQSLHRLIEASPQNPDFGTHNEDVSILFLDIAGYTKMSEKFRTEELNTLVETYFSSFLDDIHCNHGEINEVAGDGLMIIFQSPDQNQHARSAARTAVAVREKTSKLNAEAVGKWPSVLINIGIHSGLALLGANKIESNREIRWVYTATGYAANLAARIGASATGGAILVSDATAARLGPEFELADMGPQQFKGISHSVQVFRLVGRRTLPAFV